jgi:hypothetical protein
LSLLALKLANLLMFYILLVQNFFQINKNSGRLDAESELI